MTKRHKPILAIDGPAGAGKSTVAKKLAQALSYLYIDTGAMYRAVTLKAMRQGVDLKDQSAVEAAARNARLEFVPGKTGIILLDGEDVSEAIRTPEVSRNVSAYVANYPGVRKVLVAAQQRMGALGGVVMEGRDITTVVFPDAELKIYLDAAQEVRAQRRHAELEAKGQEQRYGDLLADLQRRDQEDLCRPGGALRRTNDAVVIDATHLRVEEVVDRIISLAREKEGCA
ncbi:(d)CMP kinase [candidate division FCPU426 bacterium]|nr:(d)CMP kinase [candidate division FCPU426 bacterium]